MSGSLRPRPAANPRLNPYMTRVFYTDPCCGSGELPHLWTRTLNLLRCFEMRTNGVQQFPSHPPVTHQQEE